MFTLRNQRVDKGRELRKVVVETVDELINTNDKILFLDADLGGASGSKIIQKNHPDNFIEMGISEANMVGVAAGLSTEGFIPFIHSFGPFASRRVFDQVFLSGAYAHTTINIYGSDPGFTAAANGGTHTTFEDMALMRELPNAVVVDACDEAQLEWVIKQFAKMEGVHYVRATRKDVRHVYEEGSTFELGKGNVLKQGNEVLIITSGFLVADALDCAEDLEKEGISCEVIDMFTIKPLDNELIVKEAENKKGVITFENHSIYGGLGSAVAEVLAENNVNTKLRRLGSQDCFGQVGTVDYLQKVFHLTKEDLAEAVKDLIK